MALIKCPECNHEISDKIGTCIHCGFPLHKYTNKNQKKTAETSNHSATNELKELAEEEVKQKELAKQQKEDRRKKIKLKAIKASKITIPIIVIILVFSFIYGNITMKKVVNKMNVCLLKIYNAGEFDAIMSDDVKNEFEKYKREYNNSTDNDLNKHDLDKDIRLLADQIKYSPARLSYKYKQFDNLYYYYRVCFAYPVSMWSVEEKEDTKYDLQDYVKLSKSFD